MNTAVVGLGKLGSVLAAHLGAAGHWVRLVDTDDGALGRFFDRHAEPGLDDLIAQQPTHFGYELPLVEMVFVVVSTPSKDDDNFDDANVVKAVQQIGEEVRASNHTPTVVVVSTLTPGTMEGPVLQALNDAAGREVPLAYSPQFIALGSIVADMASPDLLLIGAEDDKTADRVEQVMGTFVTAQHVAKLSLTEAEIAKLAVNCMVTTKISWANTIAEACAQVGADPTEVLKAVGSDHRIGNAYLRPGGPYGGPCFPRDNRAMAAWLDRIGAPSRLPTATDGVNRLVVFGIFAALRTYRSVAILGLSYKPGTPEWTESLGIEVAEMLAGWDPGIKIVGHDPQARPPHIALAGSAREAIDQAEVVLIATPWQAYETLEIDKDVLDPWRTR